MVQETAIAEGTDVMFSDDANDGITDLAQVGANIDNLEQACTSTSGSGGRRSRRKSRRRKSRRRKSRRRSRRIRIKRRSRRSRITKKTLH